MRFQVPQFVDVEDKIIGPLTLRQFIIYLVGSLLLIPVFLRSDLSLFLTIAIPVMGVAALFAHFRLHGKSLLVVLTHFLSFYFTGTRYVWRRTSARNFIKLDRELTTREEPEEERRELSPLRAKAKQIETEGNIVGKDEADPLEDDTI
jgi:hypothetical protein